jgi:hypothetical protein
MPSPRGERRSESAASRPLSLVRRLCVFIPDRVVEREIGDANLPEWASVACANTERHGMKNDMVLHRGETADRGHGFAGGKLGSTKFTAGSAAALAFLGCYQSVARTKLFPELVEDEQIVFVLREGACSDARPYDRAPNRLYRADILHPSIECGH